MLGSGRRSASRTASRLVEEALTIARCEGLEHNAVNIARGLAWAYLFDGRFRAAQELIARALAELEPMEVAGKPSDLWFGVRSMTASILFHSDQLEAAMATARDTHARTRQHNNRTVGAGTATLVAHAHLLRGEYAEAARWADVSLELAREIGNVNMGRPASAIAIAARVELGLPVVAGRYLRHIESGLAGATSLPLHLHLVVEALLALGEWKRAESIVEHAERHQGGRLRTALCASARAELLRHDQRRLDEAEHHANRALALAEEIDSRSTVATDPGHRGADRPGARQPRLRDRAARARARDLGDARLRALPPADRRAARGPCARGARGTTCRVVPTRRRLPAMRKPAERRPWARCARRPPS